MRSETAVLIFVVMGAAVKSVGFALTLSRALFVDVLTCVSSIMAAYFFFKFVSIAQKPPDYDHPYGHERMLIWSALLTIMAYSFVAGLAVAGLIFWGSSEELISPLAAYTAAAGMALYAVAIFLARRVEHAGSTLAYFSSSEVLESVITIVAVALGSYVSPIYDYVGGVVLTVFLLYGLYSETRELAPYIVDFAPQDLYRVIEKEAARLGLGIRSVRVRTFVKGKYFADIVVEVPRELSFEDAHAKVDELGDELEKKGIKATIHYRPKE